MLRAVLKSKLHRLTVTEANLHYSGSITIDKKLLRAADILDHEKVQVVDVTNGVRLETYAICGEENSGTVCINGAAARLINEGDIIIVFSYAYMDNEEAKNFIPTIVHVNKQNNLIDAVEYMDEKDEC